MAVALACLSASTMGGCVGQGRETRPGTVPRAEGGVQLSIELDQRLTNAEVGALEKDLSRILSLKLVASRGSWFYSVFGGPDAQAVIRYLNQRIRYIYSQSDRSLAEAVLYSATIPLSPAGPPPPVENDYFAVNYGILLWFSTLMAEGPPDVNVLFNGLPLAIGSSRVGIVQLGPMFSASRDLNGSPITSVERIGTLVHEARHSDCAGGLDPADLQRIRSDRLPENESCGFIHSICPPSLWNDPRYPSGEHPYAGQQICDSAPWGPSAIEAIFYQAIKSDCRDCTEEERQLATAGYADTAIRVIPFWQMLDGKVGVPDMSSRGLVPATGGPR